ncbi:PD-(D/E)XK nuclease family protein [Undibacterium sp. SXout7W]|uniref:PD-(D/E)XK nuclease family protein n=1 Tax=Undibacterium sp. SXout7W TaxID=3413049 RepID=UPI003BF00CD6
MLLPPEFISASSDFWMLTAKRFLLSTRKHKWVAIGSRDYSAIQIIVPTFAHAHLLLQALANELQTNFIPPRIHTLFALLEMQVPDLQMPRASSASERLMGLYAELRQHAWLKKLFSARRNTDVLPLAQTLLTLSDELSLAMLPVAGESRAAMEQGWRSALAELPPPAQALLSEETQLVWSVWQSQLDERDPTAQRYQRLQQLAKNTTGVLVWISPTAPDTMENAFLRTWSEHDMVLPVQLDWRAMAIPQPYYHAWPALQEVSEAGVQQVLNEYVDISHIRLYNADSLEDEAVQGAQTIIDWLQNGLQNVAIIAQDRVVARRIRALLERAQIYVADETGWKLSTTRAAAAFAAWFEVITTRADTIALLDLIKSPYLQVKSVDTELNKADLVMQIELIVRRSNVLGGWSSVLSALNRHADAAHAANWLAGIARQASNFVERRSLSAWSATSLQSFYELSMYNALQEDTAGSQLIQMLQALQEDCSGMDITFSFAEWRAFVNLQMESTPFISTHIDKRVMMLPLNGARLRCFDAVLLVGADAAHLPSQPPEILFFANAVRRECGLATRESRQCQQLRDFAELLLSNPVVVLSWQGSMNGEHLPVSPWIAQLNLTLERTGEAALVTHATDVTSLKLQVMSVTQPAPSAPDLLPEALSASAYGSLVVCPYQFFAGRMLRLNALDELSDMPEKRDYGDWLHAILKLFHDQLSLHPDAEKEPLLHQISDGFFMEVLRQSPSALAYSVRWKKVIPAYIQWVEQRQLDGWQFEIGELWCEKDLTWDGGQIRLRGRIDRIDKNADDERAVLDYKTKNILDLRRRLLDGEDHQLPFYGLLSEHPVQAASYVALELSQQKTGHIDAADFDLWTTALAESIRNSMQSIQQGAALPAHGVETACQYCDMRGLCRKGAWS